MARRKNWTRRISRRVPGRRRLMLVTGGSGFLGRHLLNGDSADGWDVIAPSSSAMDIRRRISTVDSISGWKPAVIMHLASRKGDRQTIVDGSGHVAEAATACGARLVHVSTDVVFAGRTAPYIESDAPFPTIAYGRDKADAEIAVMTACPSAVMVRTSLLYGTDVLGHAQLDVQRALGSGDRRRPMTFFTDEYRCPAHASDVAHALVALAARHDVVGPLHVAGPEVLSRADFAWATAHWLGLDPSALTTGSTESSGKVRAGRVVLDSARAESLGILCRSVATAYAS